MRKAWYIHLAAFVIVVCPATAALGINFQNVTSATITQIADSEFRFDALWTDFNNDGCYDAFVYDHDNATTSRYWVNRCDGSNRLDLVSNSVAKYAILNPTSPRGSGWITTLDLNGDTREDFWLRDSGPSAQYLNRPTYYYDPVHYFSHKDYVCSGKVGCQIGDINGDGVFEVVLADREIVNLESGATLYPPAGQSGARLIVDINSDGWPDLMQPEAGGYWRNNAGVLSWHYSGFATAPNLSNRGDGLNQQAAADFDNDGDLDYLIFAVSTTDNRGLHLYRNNSNSSFTEASYGLPTVSFQEYITSYGNIVPADFNNDGLVDIAIAGSGSGDSSITILRNQGNFQFSVVNTQLGPSDGGSPWQTAKARVSVADFDSDGFLDILKTQRDTNVGVHRNVTPSSNYWLRLRVRGKASNTDGLHTTIRVYVPNTQTIIGHYQVMANSQHAQKHPHIGLGQHSRVDVEIRYPHGGPAYRYNNLAANQEMIAYRNGCLLTNWRPGFGYPPSAPTPCYWTNSVVDSVFETTFE